MKKLVVLFTLMAGVMVSMTALATEPFNATVGTDSVQLVARKPASSTTWAASTSYAIGDVVVNSGSYYFCAVAGESAASGGPTGTEDTITDNAVTWRYISKNTRQGVVVTVQTDSASGGAINLSFGTDAAVKDKGLRLIGEGATIIFTEGEYNGEIHAVSATGSNVVVGVQEF